jgi:hypothetical protein
LSERILSLAEITTFERAGALGAPVFPTILDALLARWRLPLRDPETMTRLLFYAHEGHTTQPQYTHVAPTALPVAERILAEGGGEDALPADALFGLGLLLEWQAWPFGDDAQWVATGRRWAEAAAAREPESRLFREWRFFWGDAADTTGPKVYIAPEVHARYHGRGAFGARMVHLLTTTLWPGDRVGSPQGV